MGSNFYMARFPVNFETFADSKAKTLALAATLAVGNAEAADLSRRLQGCKKGHRCESGACPVCMRLDRKWFMSHGLTTMEAISLRAGRCANHLDDARRHWTAASIIPAGFSAPLGELGSLSLVTKVKTAARCLQRAALGSTRVVGGIDISLNTENNADHTWQLQLYLLVNQPCTDELGNLLRDAFTLEPSAKRPFHLRQVYMPRTALTYVLKSRFELRSGYMVDGKHKVKKQKLAKPEHLIELAMFLDQGKPTDRLVLKGIKREGKGFKILE